MRVNTYTHATLQKHPVEHTSVHGVSVGQSSQTHLGNKTLELVTKAAKSQPSVSLETKWTGNT